MIETEFTWYKALVLIASGVAIGVGIANMVYFNRIRLNGQCSSVSPSTANVMLWLNLIVVILATIIFFWSLFRLIFTGHDVPLVNHNYNLHTHIEPDVIAPTTSVVPVTQVVPSPSYIVPPPMNSPGVINMSSFTV